MFQSEQAKGWRTRLRSLFGKSATGALNEEELRTLLFEADFSSALVQKLCVAALGQKSVSQEEQLKAMAAELEAVLELIGREAKPVELLPSPAAILMLGVNGAGKTTASAKLAGLLAKQGRKVILAAADTFRAGAIEQLAVWAQRLNVEIVSKEPGSDPASVVFEAWERAVSKNAILIADTAGRLHTQIPLIDQLKKMVRILGKDGKGAPHESFLVLDGTVGQNALAQSREFLKAAPITGLVVSKLDGTAKGGGAVSASLETSLPIRYLGVGEKAQDLISFNAKIFAQELFCA